MAHDLLEVLWIDGVQHIEEVLPRRSLVLGEFVREVDVDLLVFHELGPQRLHRELVVARYLDRLHLLLLQ